MIITNSLAMGIRYSYNYVTLQLQVLTIMVAVCKRCTKPLVPGLPAGGGGAEVTLPLDPISVAYP